MIPSEVMVIGTRLLAKGSRLKSQKGGEPSPCGSSIAARQQQFSLNGATQVSAGMAVSFGGQADRKEREHARLPALLLKSVMLSTDPVPESKNHRTLRR
jgi:hypothetical protein